MTSHAHSDSISYLAVLPGLHLLWPAGPPAKAQVPTPPSPPARQLRHPLILVPSGKADWRDTGVPQNILGQGQHGKVVLDERESVGGVLRYPGHLKRWRG